MEAGPDGVRAGGLGRPPRRLPRGQIVRVFASEDLVMARVEGSWIPALLSPRLGSHGAALWLTGEIERVLAS